jgi:hypothetical protein
MMLIPTFHDVVVCASGLVAGAFMPAVGRKIKSFFVKETTAAKSAVESAASSAVKKAL